MNVLNHNLSQLLMKIDDEQRAGEIFVRDPYPWNLNTNCIVLNVPEEEYYPDVSTDFTRQHNLQWVMTIGDALQIVYAAREQVIFPTASQLIESFNYFYKYGGFLNLQQTIPQIDFSQSKSLSQPEKE
jgi:hypothetical protein